MDYKLTRSSKREHLEGIVQLQQQNLPHNISKSEAISQGFVTVQHDVDLLHQMNSPYPHFIALSLEDEVAAYALVMLKELRNDIPVLKEMFDIVDIVPWGDGKKLGDLNYFVMGQICVGKPHRSKGLFDALYHAMKEEMQREFEVLVTEIHVNNLRSLAAHQRVGFNLVHTYLADDGNEWHVVAWDWR